MNIQKKLEQWENARIDGLISKILVVVLVLSNVFLIAKVIKANNRRTIVPPVIEKGFWVGEDAASEEYLTEMADYFVTYVMTATPRSIDTKIKNIERYLAPEVYGVIKNDLYVLAEKIKANNISQSFLPDSSEVKDRQRVIVSGTLKKFVGAVETTSEKKNYTIGFSVKNGEIYVTNFETD